MDKFFANFWEMTHNCHLFHWFRVGGRTYRMSPKGDMGQVLFYCSGFQWFPINIFYTPWKSSLLWQFGVWYILWQLNINWDTHLLDIAIVKLFGDWLFTCVLTWLLTYLHLWFLQRPLPLKSCISSWNMSLYRSSNSLTWYLNTEFVHIWNRLLGCGQYWKDTLGS